jgi:hypothetical protein
LGFVDGQAEVYLTMFTKLIDQFSRNRVTISFLFILAFSLLLAVVFSNRLFGIPVATLMRDTVSLAGVGPWTGLISNVGILFWCASTTLCFATTAVSHQQHNTTNRAFYLASGLLSAFLMVDDFFVLHESFRDYLGFPEKAFYAFYLIFFGLYFLRYGRYILTTDFLLLGLALGFLGASFGLDNFQDQITRFVPFSYYYLIEDGLKLIGIINWFGFFATMFLQTTKGLSVPMPSVTKKSESIRTI